MLNNLFALNDWIESINEHRNILVRLNEVIDWEIFREPIEEVFKKEPKGEGRKHFKEVLSKNRVEKRLFVLFKQELMRHNIVTKKRRHNRCYLVEVPKQRNTKELNRKKSKVRARVEHIFGFMTNSMNGLFNRCIGFRRNRFKIGIKNLTYNLCRYEQSVRLNKLICIANFLPLGF